MRSSKIFGLIILIIIFKSLGHAQTPKKYINNTLAEKIYLQLDNSFYTTDNTIWFKALITNLITHKPSKLSGILYVDIIDDSEEIIEHKLIKIKEGIGQGFFDLDRTYKSGTYLIRAYTKWSRNYGEDFLFKKYIKILSTDTKKIKDTPIFNEEVLTDENNSKFFFADINPSIIDNKHKKELTVYVETDKKKDTLIISKKNKSEIYDLEYKINKDTKYIKLEVKTKNNKAYKKETIIDNKSIDLQFFPESGKLVHGFSSRIGFKALNVYGKGTLIEGKIINKKGEVLTTFKSNVLGMGSFYIKNIDSTQKYTAIIRPELNENEFKMPLPNVPKISSGLEINERLDSIYITATTNYLNHKPLDISIQYKGLVSKNIKGKFKDGIFKEKIAKNDLPEGIVTFTLFDNNQNPIAERLFFNLNQKNRIKIIVNSDKESYVQREITKLNINIIDDKEKSVKANLSLKVINKDDFDGKTFDENILSYFLLSSDLKGTIESPEFYFKENNNIHLDALMLTQGWRKYKYNKSIKEIKYFPERNIMVKGFIKSNGFSKKSRKIELTMMSMNPLIFSSQNIAVPGTFNFELGSIYSDKQVDFLFQTKEQSKKETFDVEFYKDSIPKVKFDRDIFFSFKDSVIDNNVLKQHRNTEFIDDFFISNKNINVLDEIILNSYKITEDNRKVVEKYGVPDVVIKGKAIQEKKQEWSYGLYSILEYNYPDKLNIKRDDQGVLRAQLISGLPTLIIIDGIVIKEYNYDLIPNIKLSEVKSFELKDVSSRNFANAYISAFPNTNPKDVPRYGGLIFIYTYAGKGLFGALKLNNGITTQEVSVFSPTKEFYAPRYNEESTAYNWSVNDLRSLIHWKPLIEKNKLMAVNIDFYNPDNTGEILIVIEAISEDGKIGYKELTYSLLNNPKKTD